MFGIFELDLVDLLIRRHDDEKEYRNQFRNCINILTDTIYAIYIFFLYITEIMKNLLQHSDNFLLMILDLIKFSFLSMDNARIIMELNEFKTIRREEKFDLIIFESLVTESILGLGHEFNAPMITISSMPPAKSMHDIVGNLLHPSFVPSQLSPKTKLESFSDRLENLVLITVEMLFYTFFNYHNLKIYK